MKAGLKTFTRVLPLILSAAILAGCAEQPYGYVFAPQQRDQVNATGQCIAFINSLYLHTDQGSQILSDAAKTTDYITILPEGWQDISTMTVSPYYTYSRNYLDKEHYLLQIAKDQPASAVLSPASLTYAYSDSISTWNNAAERFYANSNESRRLDISYGDSYRNSQKLNGWFWIRKIEKFEQSIQIQAGDSKADYTYFLYFPVTWSFHIEDFSTALDDQSSKISFDGSFPIYDEMGKMQYPHISGTMEFKDDGSGGGDLWLYGEKCAKITFSGRSFKFHGTYSLYSEDLIKTYSF